MSTESSGAGVASSYLNLIDRRKKQKTSVRLPTGSPASRSVQASSRTPLVQTGILEIHRKLNIYRCQVDTIHPKVILAVVSEESSKLEADSDNLGGCRARRSRLVDDLAGAAVNMPAETQHSAEAKCWLVSEKLWRWQIVNDDNLPEDVQVKGVGPRAEGAVRPDSSGGRRCVPAALS